MRKLLIGLSTTFLFVFLVYILIYGFSFGSTEISSIQAIKEANANLDAKIQKASSLKANDYQQSISSLENQYKKLIAEKQNYEQLLELGVDENGVPLNKIQEYEIEKIWVTMGNYAKKQGVDLKMDITSNNSISKTYDLNFTVTGGYIQITDFLYDIERDSTLVFKLENYKMVPSGDALAATFVCRDIKLNISETGSSGSIVTNNDSQETTNNSTSNTSGNNSTNGSTSSASGSSSTNNTSESSSTSSTSQTTTNSTAGSTTTANTSEEVNSN